MTEKDYILQIKVKNGPMLRQMRLCGIENASELSRLSNVGASEVGHFLNLKWTPLSSYGHVRPQVLRICEALRCLPEDIFPPQHFNAPLENNTAEMEVGLEDIQSLAYDRDGMDDAIDREKLLTAALGTLKPRERQVVEARWGINGESKTLDELGDEFNVSRERIRQVEIKAMRKLAHPSHHLKQVMGPSHAKRLARAIPKVEEKV